jgi:hypothetical protein
MHGERRLIGGCTATTVGWLENIKPLTHIVTKRIFIATPRETISNI